MRLTLSALLISSMALGGCAIVRDSRVNPFNWFGNSRSEAVAPEASTNPLIPTGGVGLFQRNRAERVVYKGEPIDTVSDLVIERVPGGAIIRASGVAPVQGLYEVKLTPENEDDEAVDGVLSYRLEGRLPEKARAGGSELTRTVTAAHAVTDQQLRGVKTIRVVGARNARTSQR
ncbi:MULTISPECIES: hypothetical protein [Roseobacteraceae]|jgi:hypothetical protein|uniref:Lipoprotein n=1 Tax=Pseudosulfitobacter pseudonitzschiae TaxID=1402135 RepID=A0A221JZR2_9RHOB|nr:MULTISPECIES: hypothetical protein [Roseobacteraceae]ASM72221.1 lipoprotein [Pseudosulfitobacter pseudonitzschiae]